MRSNGLVLLGLLLAVPAMGAAKLRVAVDPGHGGTLRGATGPDGTSEAQLCLEIALRLVPALKKAGMEVVLTRTDDTAVPLNERVEKANAAGVDVFLSLHANSMATRRLRARIQGIETYFLSVAASGHVARRTAERENAEVDAVQVQATADPLALILADLQKTEAHADSSRLAYAVHQKLIALTGATDRGVQQAPFYVLHGVEAPAILIELGFISHPEESRRLRDPKYQERLATAIVEGVTAYAQLVERRARETRKAAR